MSSSVRMKERVWIASLGPPPVAIDFHVGGQVIAVTMETKQFRGRSIDRGMAELEPPSPPPPDIPPPENQQHLESFQDGPVSQKELITVDNANTGRSKDTVEVTTAPADLPTASSPENNVTRTNTTGDNSLMQTRTKRHLSEVVLQVKPRPLNSSLSTSDASRTRPRAGKFSERLKKIRETRTTINEDEPFGGSSKLLHTTVSSPDVVTLPTSGNPPQAVFRPLLPPVSILGNIEESPKEERASIEHTTAERESLSVMTEDSSISSPPDSSATTSPEQSGKTTDNVYEAMDNSPQLFQQLKPTPSPIVQGHIYNVLILPKGYKKRELPTPPLPSLPPPSSPPVTPDAMPPVSRPLSMPFSSPSFSTDNELSNDRQTIVPPASNRNSDNSPAPPTPTIPPNDIPTEVTSDLSPDILSTGFPVDDFPGDSPPPPLPSNAPPPLPSNDPPEDVVLPLDDQESLPNDKTFTPFSDSVSSEPTMPDNLQHILAKGGFEDFKSSPSICPGHVQFSTGGSGTTLGFTDSTNVPGSNSTLTSLSSDQDAPYSSMQRPLSVTSMMVVQDVPFQSNLKKWKVTNLAEMDDQFDTRPSSLPSSGKMRRIQSSVEPMMHSLSLSSQINSGGVNQSLESITEGHTPPGTPPPSPPKAPMIIQERLSSGKLLDEDVMVTQVAKKRWSNLKLDVKETDEKSDSVPPEETIVKPKPANVKVDSFNFKHDKENKQKKKTKKRFSSMNEDLTRPKYDLYDLEGEPEGEGNLHKINRDIPKSLSSLFDAVVSDIPGLASSSEDEGEGEEREGGESDREQKTLPTAETRNETDSFRQKTANGIDGTSHINTSFQGAAQATSSVLPEVKRSASAQPLGTPKKITGLPINQKQKMKESSSYDGIDGRPPPAQAKGVAGNVVHKRNTGRKSESLKPVKVFMQKIHPGLMYKMFLITSDTSAREVVEQGLEKANIIDDPRCFALYEVYNSSQEAIRVLQEQDCPLSSRSNLSAPTHLELRRCRIHQSKSIEVLTETVSKKKSVTLTISVLTTAGEVTALSLRKLHLFKGEEDKHLLNNYKILILDKKAGEEWLVDDQRCLLDELKGDCVVTLVDIGQYLLKGEEEKGLIIRNFPDDPTVLKSILKQTEEQISGLKKELAVKDHMATQLRAALDKEQRTTQELEAMKESLGAKYQKLQVDSAKKIEELQDCVQQLIKEKEEKQSDIEDLLTEKMQIQEELQSKGKVALGIESKMRKLEDVIKVFSLTKTELEQTVSKKATQLESMEENLAKKDSVVLEQNAKIEELLRSSKDVSSSGDKHIVRIEELESENTTLREKIKELENEPDVDHKNVKTEGIETASEISSLYSVLGSVLKQLIMSVEVMPTEQGLGVKLANDTEGTGCVVKTIANTSSAKGILQPGDKLLEVNGHMVKGRSHKEVVSVLQAHAGPVQLVVSRSDCSMDTIKTSKETIELEEKLSEQLSLNEQWKKENDRLMNELQSSFTAITIIQEQLKDKDQQIKTLQEKSFKDNHALKDIHSLKEHLSATLSPDHDESESIADTLKDSDAQEILDTLRTVESDCLKHKRSLDQLMELVITHNPDLLEILADEASKKENVTDSIDTDDVDGWC